jgi:hypothetical protein
MEHQLQMVPSKPDSNLLILFHATEVICYIMPSMGSFFHSLSLFSFVPLLFDDTF